MFKKIFLLFIILMISLQVINAQTPVVSFPKTITLVDAPINVDLYIYNPNNVTQTYTLKAHTSPYPSVFLEETIVLNANESRKIPLKITPLSNVLGSTYNSSIEIKSTNYNRKIDFQIIQKTNRKCLVDLQYFLLYVKETDNYKLELIFKNSSNRDENLEIIGLQNIYLDSQIGEITIPKNSESSLVRVFKTDLKETAMEYRCNGLYDTLAMDLPKKEKLVKPQEAKSVFTGLLGLVNGFNLETIFNSTIFQIILIFILIVLVLSFSTKYIKYIYKK